MSKKPKEDKNTKQFTLTPRQSNLIWYVQDHQKAILIGLLASVAHDMGYIVTERTQFEIAPDLKSMIVSEMEQEGEESVAIQAK